MKSTQRLFLIVAVFLIAFCGIIRCAGLVPELLTQSQAATLKDKPAPDFTLADLNGKQVKLSNLRGRPVLINFWATWCPACQAEMPSIVAAYEKHKGQGLAVLAISNENSAEVRDYTVKSKMSFPVLLDGSGAVMDIYRVRALPTTFFVNKSGVIVQVSIGSMSGDVLESSLSKILK
jgi:peroxiredoxin